MGKEISAYKKIYNEIYDAILQGVYQPGQQLPIEKELCKKYNVSRITIQNALKLLVDKDIIYRIIGKGTFVSDASNSIKEKENRIIGVVLCNISASFGTEILKSIEKSASLNGYSVIFKNSNFDRNLEIKAIRELVELNVAGIILQPTHGEVTNPEIMRLLLTKKPIVLVDRNLSKVSTSFVGSDNYQATRKVMKYLFENGHRDICFMCSNPNNTTTTYQRIEEFKNSYLEANIPFKDEYIYSNIVSTLYQTNIETKKTEDLQNIKEYIINHPNITCFFALEYSIYCLISKVLKEVEPSHRENISLVTFDGISDPHIITDVAYIKQYEDEIGYQAFRLLLKKILGEEDEIKMYLPTEFVNASIIKKIEKGANKNAI